MQPHCGHTSAVCPFAAAQNVPQSEGNPDPYSPIEVHQLLEAYLEQSFPNQSFQASLHPIKLEICLHSDYRGPKNNPFFRFFVKIT